MQKVTGIVDYLDLARLSDDEIRQLLELVLPHHATYLRELLVENQNRPITNLFYREGINRILRKHPINGKSYRIGRRCDLYQLFEVRYRPAKSVTTRERETAGNLSFI